MLSINIIPIANILNRCTVPIIFLIALPIAFLLFFHSNAAGQDKTTIGALEDVVIEPYGIRLQARIDTGAATTSLDARNITATGDTVSFNLPEKYGGTRISLPIVDWKYVRTSRSKDRRPVVEMDLCIASKRMRARVNLNDRSRMNYPMIVGRNILSENFVVDVSKTDCPKTDPCGTEKDR